MDWIGGAKKAFGIGKKAVQLILDDESKDGSQKASEIDARMTSMQAELEMHLKDAEVEMMKSQHAVQIAETRSDDRYTSRWRPTLGYGVTLCICISLMAPTLVAIFRPGTAVPDPDVEMLKLACLLLGANAGFRSIDKAPSAMARYRKKFGM
ncbi:MAG: hypothetical protein GY835_05100 [bacterium]|nr:hypothetical protein [bacterium]